MYINKVKIKNYRGFPDFEADLQQLSLIIGENETGKTNFFSALGLPLSKNEITFNQRRLKVSDINTSSILCFYKSIIDGETHDALLENIPIVSVEIHLCSPENEYEEALLGKWLSAEDAESYRIKYEFYPKDPETLIEAVKALLNGVTEVDDTRWFTFPIELYDYQITSSNNGKQISFNDLKRVVINIINAERDDFSESSTLKANSLLTRMLVSTLNNTEKSKINSAYTDFFKAIEDTETFRKIIQLDPEFDNFSSHIEDIECIPNLPDLKNILSNITLKTGNEFLYQRGLGKRNLIYIIMLFEFYKLNKEFFNLCCIEEPEAHLSVNNLRLATDFICKSASSENSLLQTIISSHNPSVINKLDISNVVVFTGKKSVSIADVSSDLQNYLRKRPNFDILKLLFSDRTILVEGPTDEALVNTLLIKKSNSLNNVEVISIGQKGYKTFLDIWLKINSGNSEKKISVVRDFDNQQQAKDDHDVYDTNNDNICVRTTSLYTLEDDLVNEGANHQALINVFDLDDTSSIDDVIGHMKNNKADAMTCLCDAILSESESVEIEFPIHIVEAVEFVT